MKMYSVRINGLPVAGTAADIMDFLQQKAYFFEGTKEEYIEWLASNLRRMAYVFIDTAQGKPLPERQEKVVEQMIKHNLIEEER